MWKFDDQQLKGTPIPLTSITAVSPITPLTSDLSSSERLLLNSKTPAGNLLRLRISDKSKYYEVGETEVFITTIRELKQEVIKRNLKHTPYTLSDTEKRLNRIAKEKWEKKNRVQKMVDERREEWEGNVRSGLLSS
ncbi:hypothetical protein TrVE_jg1587 [Triparma verrucosa]|uniref:Uncharacterized protein n=2 Tax=Triparma TaxID=722752 RepID=A0A9W7DZY2_9STRA|nr:hypothetical protein TrST_g12779 [Triparma strigata]GMH97573.1 hypothetical protein TrVE_jg1587 [Triparma verrucosa]